MEAVVLSAAIPQPDSQLGSLVARLRQGDPEAFSEIYRRTQPSLYRFALAMTGSPATAEEALQETYLRLIRKPHLFDPSRGHLLGYLFGVLRHVLPGLVRGSRRFAALEEGEQTPCAGESALAAMEQAQQMETLAGAIRTLPPHYREVLVLCDLEELDYEQAATLIGCPIGTIRSRLNRARLLLKAKLTERSTNHGTA